MGLPAGTATADTATTGAFDLRGLAAVLKLLAEAGSAEALVRRLDPLHVDYPEAARRLRVPESWLRRNIGDLPHRKMGKSIGFSEEDLKAISEMCLVRPDLGTSRGPGDSNALPIITPSSRSRSRSRV